MNSRALASSNVSDAPDFGRLASPLTADTVSNRRRFRWRGTVAALILLPSVILTVFSTPLVAESSWLAHGIDVLAWVTFVAGAALRFWATLYIGGRKETVLVTDGPYSVCRNPLYLGSFLLAVAAALFLNSLVCLVAVSIVALIYMLTDRTCRGEIPPGEIRRELRIVHSSGASLLAVVSSVLHT